MRKAFVRWVAAMLLGGMLAGSGFAASDAVRALKVKHKQERMTLKIRERDMKRYWKEQQVPKEQRLIMKHQLDRDRRALQLRQKNEMQEQKDRERISKGNQ